MASSLPVHRKLVQLFPPIFLCVCHCTRPMRLHLPAHGQCAPFEDMPSLSYKMMKMPLVPLLPLTVLAVQAIVNRFAPPSKRGAVNGTAQSLASGVRALGPFLGGLMWAVFSGLPAPGSQLIPFFIISLTAAGTITIYYFLPAI